MKERKEERERERELSRKLKCQCVENIPTFHIALVHWAAGQTHTHYSIENTIAKRYQTISLKLLTFPISLISLSSITGCDSSSASYSRAKRTRNEVDSENIQRARMEIELEKTSEYWDGMRMKYFSHIWTSEWKFWK